MGDGRAVLETGLSDTVKYEGRRG